MKILCDTNILIHFFNGTEQTVQSLHKIGLEDVVLSSITIMELYRGMKNKTELAQIKKKIKYYDSFQINDVVSILAVELVEKYHLSHGLAIPDALIAATAVTYNIPLFTYNVRDFDFVPNISLYQA